MAEGQSVVFSVIGTIAGVVGMLTGGAGLYLNWRTRQDLEAAKAASSGSGN
jgi:hypothetical protein